MILKPPQGVLLNRSHPLARGLVGCWVMNEGTGNKVFDLSGNRNIGTFYGDTGRVPGKFGSCLSFDGVGDLIQCGTVPKYANFTISTWVNFATYTQQAYAGIVNANTSGGQIKTTFGLFANWVADGYIHCILSNDTLNNNFAVETLDSTNYPSGWHHLVFTVDGSKLRYYKNGNFVSSANQTVINSGNDVTLAFGRWATYTAATSYFQGQIDVPHIWNRALTAQEVSQLYREPFAMFRRKPIELWTAAAGSGYIPPSGAGFMTMNTRYWG